MSEYGTNAITGQVNVDIQGKWLVGCSVLLQPKLGSYAVGLVVHVIPWMLLTVAYAETNIGPAA